MTPRLALCASLLGTAAHAEERTLRVYNWFDYITPKALEDFKAQNTQTKLVYDVYDTNETLEAKLLTGNSGYDVVNPGDMFFAKGQPGIGTLLDVYRSRLQSEDLIAAIVIASVFGVLVFSAFGFLSRVLVGKWHTSGRKDFK